MGHTFIDRSDGRCENCEQPPEHCRGAKNAASFFNAWDEAEGREPEPAEDGQDKGKKSASTVLVELARHLYDFGVSDSGETFGVPRNGPKVTHLIRGGKVSLRKTLARIYFEKAGRAAPQQALADALMVIEGFAQECEPSPLPLRVARHEGALWLDLGDLTGRAVAVTGDGWTVQDRAPVLFKRTELTGILPEPEAGGDLGELWDWLNVDPEDRPLVLAYLMAVLLPDIPHPVLGIFGEQGTGKTTAEKVLVSLLDPSPVPVRKPPRDADSWVTAAAGSWVVGLDNLSDVSGWLSDSICRAVTGDGDVRRALYTNGELAVFAYRRVVMLNGIDVGAIRGDLADRMLTINLHIIPEHERLEEDELWPAWNDAHPRILGALLGLAAGLNALLPSVRLSRKPRMADFARILAGVDQLHGTGGFGRYLAKQHAMATESLTGDEFVVLAAKVIAGTSGVFEGTSGELLTMVTPTDEKWRTPKGWPANARTLTQKLRKLAPVMRKAGWTVAEDDGANHDKTIRWTVEPPLARERRISDPQDPRDPHTQVTALPTAGQARVSAGKRGSETRSPDPQDPQDGNPLTSTDTGDCGSAGHAGQDSHLSLKTCCESGPLAARCKLCPESPTYWKEAS